MAYLAPILLYVALLAFCAKPKRTQRTWEPLLPRQAGPPAAGGTRRPRRFRPPELACHRIRKHPPTAGR